MLQKGMVLDSGGSQASFLMQTVTLTSRSFVNMSRNFGYYWLRLAIYVFVTICIGTINWNIGTSYSSIQVRLVSVRSAQIRYLQVSMQTSEADQLLHTASGTDKRGLHFLRLWVRHVHVDRGVPPLRGRYEGELFSCSGAR